MVRLERRERVAIVRLDRPDKLNAMSDSFPTELDAVLGEAASDRRLAAIVVVGEGKAFSVGADIAEIRARDAAGNWSWNHRLVLSFNRPATMSVPVIAVVHGFAFGGGLELSLACTFRIAADGTRLGLPEVGLGILPGGGGTQRLPRLIGPERALSLLLTGRTITAMEACDLGIVGRVVPPGRALDEALTLADEIASAAPLAVRAILAAVVSGADRPLDDAIAETENALRTLLDSRDGAEGMTAFAERRKPAFTGE